MTRAVEQARILLIEDSAADATQIRNLSHECTQMRLDIVHADDLDRGISLATENGFDLILLDLSLPDTSGLEALYKIREALHGIPIIVLTQGHDDTLPNEALRAGAQDQLSKGRFDATLLERSVHHAIGRNHALLSLQRSEERYALAMKGSNDGIWDWSLDSGEVFYSGGWKQMLGYEDGEIGSSVDEWLGRIHAEDVECVRSLLDDHVVGNTPYFEAEYRIRHKDGANRWMLTRGQAVRDRNGVAFRVVGSQTDITRRKTAEQQLLDASTHDELTGQPKRPVLLDRIERAMLRCRRQEKGFLAVLAVKVDRFQVINDGFGRAVGDKVLRIVAQRLARCLGDEDTLLRVGGARFAILKENVSEIAEPSRAAELIQRELSAPVAIGDEELTTPVSIGIATSAAGYDRPEDYLRGAEIAMHRAKTLGGGRHEIFGVDMHHHVVLRLQLEQELRRGIERGELITIYEPIVALQTGALVGFEALLRWQHPRRGLLVPADFISVAEDSGLLIPIFSRMFPRIACQLADWQKSRPLDDGPFVNVNLSSKQFNDPLLLDVIDETLGQISVRPKSIGMELTENTILQDMGAATARLKQMRSRHLRVLLDDFGTGYSSLSYLQTLPIDELKIDKSFIACMFEDFECKEIVRAIVTLAHAVGLGVVAEGIETAEQLAHMHELGCELVQGHFFGKPAPADDVTELVGTTYPVCKFDLSGEKRASVTRGRVLVVDDDVATRNLKQLRLEAEGFEVATANSGSECLTTAAAWCPDVILMNIRLPDMDGIETCRRIKQDEQLEAIPILFVTGLQDDERLVRDAIAAGGSDIISKDTLEPVLLARVHSQVAIRRAAARAKN